LIWVRPRRAISPTCLPRQRCWLGPIIRGESPPVNLLPSGWLADVVEKVGWDEAVVQVVPEVGAFLGWR
jgi:hypothetical protein